MPTTSDEWAGDVSIAIFPVKSGVLYRLSYRPMIGVRREPSRVAAHTVGNWLILFDGIRVEPVLVVRRGSKLGGPADRPSLT